ncbi:MAG: caspase family protein [Pseudomonadota bacterium]|nr:caspase family protein [Pseudomonadota bacterium]
MTVGISLHIGLNRVDPDQYEGWNGQLTACEADAKDMAALAKKQGFTSSTLLLTEAATAEAVANAILGAAKTLKSGDLFFLTYSGHGGQVDDTNGDEKDRMDETWVCYDRQFVDDELYELWGKFRSGVRIGVLSDSCHSGTVLRKIPAFVSGGPRVRAMPTAVARKVQKAHAKLYKKIQDEHRSAEKTKVVASVLLISGCMDNQTSQDGARNGLFTGTLKKVWNGGKFKGGYRKLRDTVVSKMPPDQTPNYYFVGGTNPKFEAQQPWTL